jgi:hypothetical protein
MTTEITAAAREHARQLAARHHAACESAGCQRDHERQLWAIARAHRAESN